MLLDYHKNACKRPNMNRDMTCCTYRNSTFCCRGYIIIFQLRIIIFSTSYCFMKFKINLFLMIYYKLQVLNSYIRNTPALDRGEFRVVLWPRSLSSTIKPTVTTSPASNAFYSTITPIHLI